MSSLRIESKKPSGLIQGDSSVDLALIDLNLPDGDGIEFMDVLQKMHPNFVKLSFSQVMEVLKPLLKQPKKGLFILLRNHLI